MPELLFAAGFVGAPLFVIVFAVEGVRRPSYDWLRQPVSTLALGEAGWVQRANFLVTGLLFLAFAAGLWIGPETHWVALLVGLCAIGLGGAGVFSSDPVGGYPDDMPAAPKATVAGALHLIGTLLAVVSLAAACFVALARLVADGAPGWAVYSGLSGALVLVLFVFYGQAMGATGGVGRFAGLIERLCVIVGWAWIAVVALQLFTTGRF